MQSLYQGNQVKFQLVGFGLTLKPQRAFWKNIGYVTYLLFLSSLIIVLPKLIQGKMLTVSKPSIEATVASLSLL